MSTRPAVVIGASFGGLFAAQALASLGRRVALVERDVLPDGPEPRRGVPQGRQPHVLLRRGLLAAEKLLPGITDEMTAAGGVRFRTSRMQWLTAYGWLPQTDLSHELISLSRPELEYLVRRRVLANPAIELVGSARVTALEQRGAGRWAVLTADPGAFEADLVVDASGRGSRLPQWLTALGVAVPPVQQLDASIGYAMRYFSGQLGLTTATVLAPTNERPLGALALPIGHDRWIIGVAGYGNLRPGRTEEEFESALESQRDPCVADLARALTPQSDVLIHRQTANRRFDYGRNGWPAGLLAVGDSLCALNPFYGHGITVAALQAEALAARLGDGEPADRSLQRRLRRLTDVPWSVATGEDQWMPSSPVLPTTAQRAFHWWAARVVALAAGGDEACIRAYGDLYHLMAPPTTIVNPRVCRSVARSLVTGVPQPAARPAQLPAPV